MCQKEVNFCQKGDILKFFVKSKKELICVKKIYRINFLFDKLKHTMQAIKTFVYAFFFPKKVIVGIYGNEFGAKLKNLKGK